MGTVAAFVAHSFRSDDEDHVAKFLAFLTHLSDTSPGFSWDHALESKPQDLREKVLEKLDGKDTLIAICSKHSYSVDPARVRHLFGSAMITSDELRWSTSAWIVQEIGLAFGRGMNLILLVEEGVQSPGGLQGNIEYIPFNRASPERAFTRLMQMINAIVQPGSRVAQPVSLNPPPEPASAEVVKSEEKVLPPRESMTLEELMHGWFLSLLHGLDDLRDEYRKTFLGSEHGATELARARWDAREQWLRQLVRSEGDLSVVRKLREKWATDGTIAKFEGRLYELLEEHSLAADSYLDASANVTELDEKVACLNLAARALTKSREFGRVENVLDQVRLLIAQSPDPHAATQLLKALPDVYAGREEWLRAASLEAVLQADPDDHGQRFALGYLYSELKAHKLAYFHYTRVPIQRRSAWIWNNLGVAAGDLKLKGVSVNAYDASIAAANTLAISNRARLLKGAGFFAEAEEACRKALSMPECDPQVAETLTQIEALREEEKTSSNKIMESAQGVSSFMRAVGRACTQAEANGFGGAFQLPQCVCEVSVKNGEIEIAGTFKRPKSQLGIMLGALSTAEEDVLLKFVGKRYGNAVVGSVSRTPEGRPPTILASVASPFCCYFDVGERRLHILEIKSDHDSWEVYSAGRVSQ